MELQINEKTQKVKCPICGKVILDMDDGESNPCKHIKLIYSDSCGQIVHTSDDLEKDGSDMSEKMSDLEADYDIMTLLEECAKKHNLEICEVTTSGMSCGPCSNTDYYLVDMSKTFKSKKSKKSLDMG